MPELIACGVWLRSSSRTESRICPPLEREAAQLGASGLGSHVAAKSTRGWRGGRRTGRRRRATAERHAKKITVMRETKGDACVLPEYQQGTMEESTERTRWIPCARAVRSARAAIAPTHTLSTASDGTCTRALSAFCVSCCLSCGSLARITMNLEAGVGGVPFFMLLFSARRQRQAKASSRRIVHVKTRLDERYCVKVLNVHTCTGLGDQFSDILCRKFVLENSLFS
jgi:hypothetical protein